MTQIQIRRGNASAWAAANPILAQGELAVELDTSKIKVGDGSTAWNSLRYFPANWDDLTARPTYLANGGGNANGYATLDSGGKVPVSQLPSSIMEYQGVWNASTNTPTLADGTGNTGDVYRVTVAGARNLGSGSITWEVGDYAIYNGSTWERSDSTDAVTQVAGVTGIVTQDQITGLSSTGLVKRTGANTLAIATVGTDYITPGGANHVDDMSIVAFGASTVRATGTGDFPFGIRLPRAVTITSVTYRCATADASGNLVVELRKNGSAVSGSSATITAANQVTPGGTATGSWSFSTGDILTVYITAVGTTPGKGIIADLTAVTA